MLPRSNQFPRATWLKIFGGYPEVEGSWYSIHVNGHARHVSSPTFVDLWILARVTSSPLFTPTGELIHPRPNRETRTALRSILNPHIRFSILTDWLVIRDEAP